MKKLDKKTVHLIGIGGMGMISLAGLFKDLGWQVQGSDKGAIYPPASDEVARLGIKTFAGYAADNISEDLDLVIVGNVVSFDHVEYQAVLSKGIAYTSMAQALGTYFLEGRDPIVISGTHGKTTTSSLMSFMLDELQQSPGFFIGGIPHQFKQGYQLGQGKNFVLEGDEYDTACFEKTPKFLHYKTKHLILTSVEFDHADIYDSLESIMQQFKLLIKSIDAREEMIVCGDDENIQALMQTFPQREFISYGEQDHNTWVLKNYAYQGSGIFSYDCMQNGKKMISVKSRMMGKHNAMNALACLIQCHKLGLDLNAAALALGKFEGVARRQQWLSSAKDIHVYDDFGHHPTAVQKTLAAFKPIQEKNGGRLWAIFEPRSNTSRRNTFQKEWPLAFGQADVVVLTPVYQKADGLKDGQLNLQQVKADLESKGKQVHLAQSSDDLVAFVCKQAKTHDTVVFMSNGDFGGARERVLTFLKA